MLRRVLVRKEVFMLIVVILRRTGMLVAMLLIFAAGCSAPAVQSPATTPAATPEATESTGATEETTAMPRSDESQILVNLARANLRERLCVSRDEITVESVAPVEFPDTSLGVPEPGRMYSQVITPGYVIRLAAAGEVYEYHGSGNRIVFAPDESTAVPTCANATPTSEA
jgi:hypothetical protein